MVQSGERKRFGAGPGLQRAIPVRHEEIVEELHIEVVVLDDQHLLRPAKTRFRDFHHHALRP
jgi:hypothetical protein